MSWFGLRRGRLRQPLYQPLQPQQILQPVKSWFIFFSLCCAFLWNVLPWGSLRGVPDLLALTLIFWNVHQPRKVGIGLAWFFGLLVDVHHGGLLGEHALAYTLLSYGAITLHRRMLWFPLLGQAAHVLPLLLTAQLIVMAVRILTGGIFPGWTYLLAGLTGALIWPLLSVLLLAPQRRPVEKDATRPI